jgi:hypothetical protein
MIKKIASKEQLREISILHFFKTINSSLVSGYYLEQFRIWFRIRKDIRKYSTIPPYAAGSRNSQLCILAQIRLPDMQ